MNGGLDGLSPNEQVEALRREQMAADIARRVRRNARDEATSIRTRLNRFLLEEDNRSLLTFVELKVLGATSDMLAAIETRLGE